MSVVFLKKILSIWRRAGLVVNALYFQSDGRKVGGSVVRGQVGLFIAVLFPETRNSAPHCLSSPRCISGHQ